MRRFDVALGLLMRGDRCFLQRRDPAASVLPGLWEFPGGKVEAGETPGVALCRELAEELALEAEILAALEPRLHRYPDREVTLHPFLCRGRGPLRTALAWGWFTPWEVGRLRLPEANRALLPDLFRIAEAPAVFPRSNREA